ncbi:Arginase/deacetylase [Linnemannia elongata AG-77]|uniref:Arginase/deacetylase n=1 Tax=Linnemannia elongata AG-77 TaxID=1314771 RepID=A0A197JJW9_9FUNG|nr:Arginase/deacetylase [Linnemannia elongata AG-77]
MKVFTSKLCTTLHTPEFEFHGGAQSQHYECPERREAILKYLESHSDSFEVTEHVEDFGYEPIKRVHKQGFLNYLETAYDEWILEGGHPNGVMPSTIPHYRLARLGGQTPTNSLTNAGEYCFDMSAVITKDTFKAAWNAAQVTLTATKDLVRVADQYEKGLAAGTTVSREAPPGLYALVRPPGHHAQSDLCGGYCFLNNVGIAAQWLIDRPELRQKDGQPKKVAIIDIDFHHGNGTQELFYKTSNPLYASLHGRDAYPHFTGAATERGEGEGLGFSINVPLPRSTSDDEYVEALEKLIQEHIIPYDADYIIISLGVDTFKDDPIAGFLVTSEAYPRIGNAIRKIGLPTLFVQEGGYCVEKLGLNVGGILQGFLGKVAA